ncbi:MAG: HIT domain-containing protein [Verrucomicrobia bacterium]|nr:HIT domain-containing protein [Verrucomicrobiota bacterium]MBU4292008.1 HIT domain-containing protein [Verrucomicrobiota bacterium]MBU4427896.1 HIT domain-containing protein [Verrucomicrobiota bacterium]MCG2678842.1 HIT domain-containing protein [Kiritimatiellia bacterium]
MERLWAPWRMDYILKSREPGCFLCEIAQSGEDQKNLVLRRGEVCLLVMNRYPYNNGHLMVAPYRHVDSLEAMDDKERLEMMTLSSLACTALKKAAHPDGFNIGINLGVTAGAGLKDHIHLHIVPRWEGDTNFMPVIAEVKVIPQSLDALWRQLGEVLG